MFLRLGLYVIIMARAADVANIVYIINGYILKSPE